MKQHYNMDSSLSSVKGDKEEDDNQEEDKDIPDPSFDLNEADDD